MKKIFILTGESSGDKLASTVIEKIQKQYIDIKFLSVGGSNLKSLGINSIFSIEQITYMGFTSVLFNIFKIKKKIDFTVKEIIKFEPDILFSVDSPDFTLRVAERVKKINANIKTIHYVAPQVWIWREGRVKKFKNFIDHFLLLFDFERKYFDKENIPNTFVGHPLLEKKKSKVDISHISRGKKIISIFPGSRMSELKVLLPILIEFIKLMNTRYKDFVFVFHSTIENINIITEKLEKSNLDNCDIVADKDVKSEVLLNSVFAVSKSGTVSLEICNAKVPSIIIYKINYLNYLIMKSLVKVKYANIINIINKREIIPELLQSECNAKEIFKSTVYFLKNPKFAQNQVEECLKTLDKIRPSSSSSDEAAKVLNKYLIS
ncbi:lipid-A-disaccharide synthase [Candidatus Pelagibacter sp.]|nr:lipid-A-disaccharide synthase [Candidatus Pelagibacter sp.]